jgi:hypothetical protein
MDVVPVKGVKTCSNGNVFSARQGSVGRVCWKIQESFLGDACGKHGQWARLDRFLCLIWEMPKLPDNFLLSLPNQSVRIYKRRPWQPKLPPNKHACVPSLPDRFNMSDIWFLPFQQMARSVFDNRFANICIHENSLEGTVGIATA